MKKFSFFLSSVLFISLFSAKTLYSSKLMEAIDTLDLEKVEKLVKENQITQEEKIKLLNYLATLIDESKISTKSIWNSKTDLVRVILGLFCTINVGVPVTGAGLTLFLGGIASYLLTKNDRNRDGQEINLLSKIAMVLGIPVIAGGGAILGFGVDQIKKGVNLFSAYHRLKKARQIETLIEDSTVKSN